jgi:uncharacterized protein DUF3667
MVSGIEGVGEAVTGGMIARAVEPETGDDGHTNETSCLNCGAELVGAYCHRCGQKGHVHRTLTGFLHDLSHSVLHFEGKIWRTLPLLAWRPGELTRRYTHGERARFVSPIALFLFSVFLMFAIFSWVGGPFTFSQPEGTAEGRAEAEREFAASRDAAQAEINGLRAERARAAAAGRPTAALDDRIAGAERRLAVQERVFRSAIDALAPAPAPKAGQPKAKAAPPIVLAPNSSPEGARKVIELDGAQIDTGWGPLDRGVAKAVENPALLAYKLQTNAYKFSWALIPISVPFVWLLFLHRRRYRAFRAYDHTVFVTYSIAFMSLGLIVLSLLRPLGVGGPVAGLAITFVPPIHMYRQLRGAYGLSRFSAIWRTLVLVMIAFWAATIFLVLLVALGALG